MSRSLYIPEGYKSALTLRETQHAIKYIKDVFQQALSFALTLDRVSAPLIVKKGSGINDDLNGVERKVDFDIKEIAAEAEVGDTLTAKRHEMFDNAVVASEADFDSVWDSYMADYLSAGGQAIMDERAEKWAEYFGDSDMLP